MRDLIPMNKIFQKERDKNRAGLGHDNGLTAAKMILPVAKIAVLGAAAGNYAY